MYQRSSALRVSSAKCREAALNVGATAEQLAEVTLSQNELREIAQVFSSK
jgi:hypothetical protein